MTNQAPCSKRSSTAPFVGRTHELLDITTRTIDSITTSIHHTFRAAAHAGAQAAHQQLLTAREQEILGLMAAGMTNPQIAVQLVIGAGTVKTHTLHIYRKLEVANRTQAIVRALALRILQTRSHVRMVRPQDAPRRRPNHRPLSMDMHDHIEALIADALAQAHAADLETQEKYSVMYLRYWFDETSDMAFCLV
ncbi:MAG TPA: nickel-binding protein, partial [Roseiflexaceae bacterium]|nr:nickel-binding protein [Roseiflexaceae bacterium]